MSGGGRGGEPGQRERGEAEGDDGGALRRRGPRCSNAVESWGKVIVAYSFDGAQAWGVRFANRRTSVRRSAR